MQKLITVTIDVEKLQQTSTGAFTITEVEEINALLGEGWAVEEFEFISGDEDSSKAVMLLVLNDSLEEPAFDEDLFGDDEEEEEETGKRMLSEGLRDEDDEMDAEKEEDEEEEEKMSVPGTVN